MKIKKLEWKKLDLWIAKTPFARHKQISIYFEQDKYWAIWPNSIYLDGFDTLEAAMQAGQEFHENELKKYLEV